MIKTMVERLKQKVQSIEEKKDDRCTRIAKRKYDAWPSAYASGAVVRCRRGEIWKDLKETDDTLDENTEYEQLTALE
jgi:ketosteroid isomerase-like protein